MSFDLIIANPPYGKSSSLSKKIVNKMLENKIAEEYVVLAPSRSFLDCTKHITAFSKNFPLEDFFEVCDANDATVQIVHLDSNKSSDLVKDLSDLRLSKDEKRFLEAIQNYSGKVTWKPAKEGDDESRIFSLPFWAPFSGIRRGHSYKANYGEEPVKWSDSSQKILFPTEAARNNFRDWWYTKEGGLESIEGTFLHKLFYIARMCYSSTPSTKQWCTLLLPRVDWSHPWTDQEILAEIGLPEDFLSVGLNII